MHARAPGLRHLLAEVIPGAEAIGARLDFPVYPRPAGRLRVGATRHAGGQRLQQLDAAALQGEDAHRADQLLVPPSDPLLPGRHTLQPALPAELGYLHINFRRENPTTMRRDFVIAEGLRGPGRLVGRIVGVRVLDRCHWYRVPTPSSSAVASHRPQGCWGDCHEGVQATIDHLRVSRPVY